MSPRLTSDVLAGALLRRAQSEGGFGAVLARGDATAGAIAIILLARGRDPRLFERVLQPDGGYRWEEAPGAAEAEGGIANLVARRRRFDPDLWIIELDIADPERFAAEMNSIG